jgi:hypothetical protein
MADAPRDATGRVLPHDDPTIGDDEFVIRYIPEQWFVPAGEGKRRLSKAAFAASSRNRDPYEGMSVDLLTPLLRDGYGEVGRSEHFAGAAKIRVGALRSLGLWVGPDDKGEGDIYHANVWGVTDRLRRKILDRAQLTKKPNDVLA